MNFFVLPNTKEDILKNKDIFENFHFWVNYPFKVHFKPVADNLFGPRDSPNVQQI